MKHKYLNQSLDYIKKTYQKDVYEDVILNRNDKIICFGEVSKNKDVELHIVIGNFTDIGFPDQPTLQLSTLLEHLDLENAYADVGGKKEYYDSIIDEVLEFSKPTNLTFPVRNDGNRHWVRLTTFSIDPKHKLQSFHFTIVTDFIQYDEDLYRKSHRDSLTDLFNRYTLDYHYGLRYQFEGFHVMYIDLDDFKMLNDTLGHSEGNNYLKRFAKILTSYDSDYTRFYRLGGDEFVGFIFESREKVEEIANEIIEKAINLSANIDHVKTSVSIGIIQATIRENVIEKADKLMYKAKELGKSRYIIEVEE